MSSAGGIIHAGKIGLEFDLVGGRVAVHPDGSLRLCRGAGICDSFRGASHAGDGAVSPQETLTPLLLPEALCARFAGAATLLGLRDISVKSGGDAPAGAGIVMNWFSGRHGLKC